MKIKKIIAVTLILALALFTFAACSGKEPTRLLMVTGGTAGTYFAYGGVIATTLTNNLENIEITAQTSGASAANARAVNNGEAELGIIQNDVLYYAFNGIEIMADDGGMPGLRTIATLYPEVVQLVATQASGATSVEDLRGLRVCVGDAGSGTEANARQVVEAYGLSFNDFRVENLSFADASTAMQNGTIDAAFTTAGVPNPAITELANAIDIVIIPISGTQASNLMADYGFYTGFTIGNDAYGVPGADTVAVLATLFCSTSLSEDLVYTITKGLFDNQAELATGHARGAELSPSYAVRGAGVPFHSGAEKYFKEVGALS